jgi:hypothetical protein
LERKEKETRRGSETGKEDERRDMKITSMIGKRNNIKKQNRSKRKGRSGRSKSRGSNRC